MPEPLMETSGKAPTHAVELTGQEEWVRAIHAAPERLVAAITGGGSRLISDLLVVPGASRTLLEALVPYSAESLHSWLGIVPDSHCSDDTALQMASQAQRRAITLLTSHLGYSETGSVPTQAVSPQEEWPAIGLGITAALATDRSRRGAERAWLATHSLRETTLLHVEFEKQVFSRREEEAQVARCGLLLLATTCGVTACEEVLSNAIAASGPLRITLERAEAPVAVRSTLTGVVPWAVYHPEKGWSCEVEQPPVGLISGSFHPLHAAHQELARVAAELLQSRVDFELPLFNADKPPVDYLSLARRVASFQTHRLFVSRAATFAEKGAIFPQVTFVVGADTAARVLDLRFYGHSSSARDQALQSLLESGNRFLVAARRVAGKLITLDALEIPERYQVLFHAIPLERFQWDLSSTEIRRSRQSAED